MGGHRPPPSNTAPRSSRRSVRAEMDPRTTAVKRCPLDASFRSSLLFSAVSSVKTTSPSVVKSIPPTACGFPLTPIARRRAVSGSVAFTMRAWRSTSLWTN